MGALGDREHFVDELVARIRLRLQVQLGTGFDLLRKLQILAQLLRLTGVAVPQDLRRLR